MAQDENQALEDIIMAHRYLYYVLCDPVLPDLEYDELDRKATALLPSESPVHQVGSSLESSYDSRIIK